MAGELVRAAAVADVERAGRLVVNVDGSSILLLAHDGEIYAVDNRCPHMGFPLHRGTVKDGILTCHWHHARFELNTGGTFDQFADDVRAFPTAVVDDHVWVDLTPRGDALGHQRERMREGLENDIPLVIAKASIFLLESGDDPVESFRIGLDFGTRYRDDGWGQGLTMLTALYNLVPLLDAADRPLALYQGLSAVARDTAGMPARFLLRPLPGTAADPSVFKRWFRQFVEVRDEDGAERCIISAVRSGATATEMADMMFAAATDHRYIQIGHVLDFTNKAFEALDAAGWDRAEQILSSLARGYASAQRMEESSSWRHPVDLIAILDAALADLPAVLDTSGHPSSRWEGFSEIVDIILGEEPRATIEALLDVLQLGVAPEDLAGAVAYAAALRIAHFHTSNEFSDWDTALHTFTFANAVHQGLLRVRTVELVRGVFDAAMSVYLDRFLNIPPTPLPRVADDKDDPDELISGLGAVLDHQQQVNRAGESVARYLDAGGDEDRLLASLGRLLLREDRDFHTIQTVEASVRQFLILRGRPEARNVLVTAARYLAAHSPTVRAQGQTYDIARRLARGETLYEDPASPVATA